MLRVGPSDKGVLGVVIDAPPMKLIGPELVHDLVGLLGALESDHESRVVVLESAAPKSTEAPGAQNHPWKPPRRDPPRRDKPIVVGDPVAHRGRSQVTSCDWGWSADERNYLPNCS
jgi:hypothetical protein